MTRIAEFAEFLTPLNESVVADPRFIDAIRAQRDEITLRNKNAESSAQLGVHKGVYLILNNLDWTPESRGEISRVIQVKLSTDVPDVPEDFTAKSAYAEFMRALIPNPERALPETPPETELECIGELFAEFLFEYLAFAEPTGDLLLAVSTLLQVSGLEHLTIVAEYSVEKDTSAVLQIVDTSDIL